MANSVAKQRGYFPRQTLERFIVLHRISVPEIILWRRARGATSFPSFLLPLWFPACDALLRLKLRMELSMDTWKFVQHEIYMCVCVCVLCCDKMFYDMHSCAFGVRRREVMHHKPHSCTQNVLPEMLRFIHDVSSLLTSVIPTDDFPPLHALQPEKPAIDSCQINGGKQCTECMALPIWEETTNITYMPEMLVELTRVFETSV
jgi:hypothetical protein